MNRTVVTQLKQVKTTAEAEGHIAVAAMQRARCATQSPPPTSVAGGSTADDVVDDGGSGGSCCNVVNNMKVLPYMVTIPLTAVRVSSYGNLVK